MDIKANKDKSEILSKTICLLIVILVMLTSCCLNSAKKDNQEINNNTINPIESEIQMDSSELKVQNIIEKMSLSDMVYQMMFVTPESITGVGVVTEAGNQTKSALNKYPVGGIIYFDYNFISRKQTANMLSKVQEYSKIPLFVGVDEEGGRVARLGEKPEMGTTHLPPMLQIGQSGDVQKAYEAGVTLSNDLSALGFNVNFAPDADVIINPNNTEIGDRSFGSDPNLVAAMVSKIVEGLQSGGVSATLKHFPGHGSTYRNSHSGYSESTRTIEELRSNEFLPFRAGMDAGTDFIMISHMTLVNATKEKVPSSVSKEVITDMLKTELGYTGIIITDSFAMGAVTDMYSTGKAAVKAIQAGVDMILMPPDVEGACDAIINAVETGEIQKERIEESVKKILSLKIKKGMIQ